MDWGNLLITARQRSGLTPAEFANELGVDLELYIEYYEAGIGFPPVEVLDKALYVAHMTLDPQPVEIWDKTKALSLALAAAVAAEIDNRDYKEVCQIAEGNMARNRAIAHGRAKEWVDEWAAVLEQGPEAVKGQLLEAGEHGDDMRQMNPFAGLLTQQSRRSVIATLRLARQGRLATRV